MSCCRFVWCGRSSGQTDRNRRAILFGAHFRRQSAFQNVTHTVFTLISKPRNLLLPLPLPLPLPLLLLLLLLLYLPLPLYLKLLLHLLVLLFFPFSFFAYIRVPVMQLCMMLPRLLCCWCCHAHNCTLPYVIALHCIRIYMYSVELCSVFTSTRTT